MAFPIVQSSSHGSSGSSTTSHSVTLPSGITTGDLLLILIANDKYSGSNPSASGWTYEGGQEVGSPPTRNYPRMGVLSRVADGSEGSSVTVTTDVAKYASWIALRISGATGVADIQSAILQTTTNPDPPSSGTVAASDRLSIAVAMANDETATVSSYPSGYSANQIYEASGDTTGIAIALATDEITGTTEDPGSFTFSASSDTSSVTILLESASGSTVSASSGSFALAGYAAALLVNVTLIASSGAFSFTGNDATLSVGGNYTLSAETGSFALTGQDASLVAGGNFDLSAETVSFALSGQDASLTVGGDYLIVADYVSFALTGNDANLTVGGNFPLASDAASFSLTGQDANLVVGGNFDLLAESGSYVLNGQSINLVVGGDYSLAAEYATFILAGQSASLVAGGDFALAASYGEFTLAGQNADLTFQDDYVLTADVGSFDLIGSNVTLAVGGNYTLVADHGTFALSGSSALLLYSGSDCIYGVMFVAGVPLFVDGVPAMSTCCCCSTECPCCYYGLTIKRDAGPTFAVRTSTAFCSLSADTIAYAHQCDDETFALTLDATPPDGCTCYASFSSDSNNYSSEPCFQQYYTEAALDQVCNYNPPGPGTGQEIHYGTMSFREVFTLTFCYDPCGTATVSLNHKVYCNFGVYVFDSPPPLSGAITHTFVSVSTDLVLDSTWTWSGVTCPNCESLADLGAPTSETLAPDYTKTWGTAFTNCGGSSSFTVTIPGACEATGLELIGGGTPCECAAEDAYTADGYFADGYHATNVTVAPYDGYVVDGYFADGYFANDYN